MVEIKKGSEFKRELLQPWTYVGTLYSIIDLGTQIWDYQWQPTEQRKVRLSRELPNEMRVFKQELWEQPMAIHKEYTLSFNEKSNLRKDLKSWRGKDITEAEEKSGLDLETLIGTNCLLSIGIKDGRENQYNVINAISPLMKWGKEEPQINKTLIWHIDNGMDEVYNKLPKFIQDKILACKERNQSPVEAKDDSDLPF